jgi:DNA-directed RNA polymerase specialized sigma24 family protein
VRVDEQDVLQSMYASFCLRQQRGDFSLGGREDLWQLLVTMTLNKTRNAAARHRAGRRDYRREQGAAAGAEGSMTPDEALAAMEGAGPTPDEAAELTEQLHARLRGLPEALRRIALWKLEGYTHEEIAAPERLNCTVRTVERKLHLIREHWQAEA